MFVLDRASAVVLHVAHALRGMQVRLPILLWRVKNVALDLESTQTLENSCGVKVREMAGLGINDARTRIGWTELQMWFSSLVQERVASV